jgi:hypothetical protein
VSDSVTDKPLRDWRWLALGAGAVLALTVVAILATIGLAWAFDVDFDDLSRDPTSVYKGPVYAGWFSNLVTLLWQVPVTCALLAAVVLRATRRAGAAMFLTAGLIGAVLAADDLFLIHEFLAESVRLPDLVLPILYGIAVVAFMIVFRGRLGTAGIALVAVALLLWTASIGSIVATQQHGQVLASALKLAGVGFWALLILRLAFVALRDLAGAAPEEDQEPEDDEPEDEEPPPEPPAPKPAKKKPAKKAAKKVEEPAPVAVSSAVDLQEEDDEGEPDDDEPEAEAPAPVPTPVAAAPVAAPAAAPAAAPEPALWPPAAEPADPVTEMQRVVPPLPPRPDPQPEPVTRPMPVTRVPDTRTVAQPIVRAAPRPPTDPGRGRRPEPPRPPQRPGPPPAPQQQPSSAPPPQPPTGPEPAVPPAPPQPHPLASTPMPPAQPPPPPARSDQDGPRHRRN